MKAKEMFEKLGYYQKIDTETLQDKEIISYIDDYDRTSNINFVNCTDFSGCYYSITFYHTRPIPKDLLKAINKQIEELGWDNE